MIRSWWTRLTGQRVAAEAASRPLPLRIASAGLCCAVGHHLRAAVCAIRANMDHFQNSEFRTGTGERVKVGRLPERDCWGAERLARWIAWSIADCLREQPRFDTSRCALVVLAPDPARPDMDEEPYWEIITRAMREFGRDFHDDSRILPLGRAGLAQALSYASRLLAGRSVETVLLVGGDSLLDVAVIEHYLADDRLLLPGNSDGFLPGEAAGAVLLVRADAAAPGVIVRGWAQATEAATWNNEMPNRAIGLTEALRAACAAAGVAPEAPRFRLSDQNGEAYYAKEASNAFTRLRFGADKLAHLTLADKLGEVGAATGVAALAYLSQVMPRPDCSPGELGIVHLANDDGLRCAVVVQHRTQE